jgi:Helix-turn-helix family
VARVPAQLPAGLAARANRALDALPAMLYFAPESEEELTGVGLRPGRMCYFAGRSAAMGPVPAGVTTATFYNFSPALVARHIPRAWTLASPEDVLGARVRAADKALRRVLGEEAAQSSAVVEAAGLARAATAGLAAPGRALYAAHAELPWPDEPHLVLWHAATLLREYRGDGHVAVLLATGLTGLDALITHTATGRGFTEAAAKATRGWSDEDWSAGVDRLCRQGLMDERGLTEDGLTLRASIEQRTDDLAASPWLELGEERTARLIEVGRALSRQVVTAGAFPPHTFASR